MKKFLLLLILCSFPVYGQTQINGNQIKNGAITNAKVASDAAIAASKINFAGATPELIGAETPLTFSDPLVRTGNTISFLVSDVSHGGTGLSSLAAGLIPFGDSSTTVGTNVNFNWDNALEKLSITALKVTSGTPQIGYMLTATDTDGNLTFTDPLSMLGSAITGNTLVIGNGVSIESAPYLTYIGTTLSTPTLTINQGAITLTTIAAPGAPVLTATVTGTKPAGDWTYKTAWVTDTGETELGTVSDPITVDGTKAVSIAQPSDPPLLATGWKVYSSKLGPTSTWWELAGGTLSMSNTNYDDNADDTALTIEATNYPATAGRAIFLDANKVVGFDSDKTFIGAVDITDVWMGQLGQAKITATGLKLNPGSKPTCDITTAGTIWYVAGGTGILDTCELCYKSAADAYAWITIFTPGA